MHDPSAGARLFDLAFVLVALFLGLFGEVGAWLAPIAVFVLADRKRSELPGARVHHLPGNAG